MEHVLWISWYLLAVMKVKVVVQVWRVRLVWVDHHVVLPVRHVSSVQLSENQCVVAVVAATVVGARMNVRREECLLVAPRLARERIFQAEHLLGWAGWGGETERGHVKRAVGG